MVNNGVKSYFGF